MVYKDITIRPRMENKMVKTSKLGREDWIKAAFHTLSESGVTAVRVEVLAKRLGVTKGSFYWHFKNRQTLLNDLLEKWRTEQRVMNRVDVIGGSPREKLVNLLDAVPRSERRTNIGATELAVRSWARMDENAAKTIAIVDEERIEWVKSYFVDMGYDEKTAESRAFLTYGYIMVQGIFSLENMPHILERIHDDVLELLFSK